MATANILRVVCSGTAQLRWKNDFYKVVSPYIVELSSNGAIPKCNPTTLNSCNLRRLIESFEEDVAPDLDQELVRKCRVQLTVLEKLYYAIEMLELQGLRVAAKFLSELIDGGHGDVKEEIRMELVNNEALMRLYIDFKKETEAPGDASELDSSLAVHDKSIMKGKLNKLADILEKYLRSNTAAGRVLIAVPSATLAEEVNKIIVAFPQLASSFFYDMRCYSKDVHKNFINSRDNCIVVISDPSTGTAPIIEIAGIDLAICYGVPKTAFRKVPKWKGSIRVLLTDVESRSFHETTLLADDKGPGRPKSYSTSLKACLAKQIGRTRKGHLTKDEQATFDREFRCSTKIVLPNQDGEAELTASQRRYTRRLSLTEWGPWQRKLQQTFAVGHSRDAELLVEALALCDSLRESVNIDTYEKQLNSHLCREDVIMADKCRPGLPTGDEVVADSEGLEYCNEQDLRKLDASLQHYVLDSDEKFYSFLSEVGFIADGALPKTDTVSNVDNESNRVTSTSPISLVSTDGHRQSLGSPKISPPALAILGASEVPPNCSNGSRSLRETPARQAERCTLEGDDFFSDVVTPAVSKQHHATSTPFDGSIPPKQIAPAYLTPLRPNNTNQRNLTVGSVPSLSTAAESTPGQSRLGVTALVNIVQRRKKQKNLQYFFGKKGTTSSQERESTSDIVVISDSEGASQDVTDVTVVPQCDEVSKRNDPREMQHHCGGTVGSQVSIDGEPSARGSDESLFDSDEALQDGKLTKRPTGEMLKAQPLNQPGQSAITANATSSKRAAKNVYTNDEVKTHKVTVSNKTSLGTEDFYEISSRVTGDSTLAPSSQNESHGESSACRATVSAKTHRSALTVVENVLVTNTKPVKGGRLAEPCDDDEIFADIDEKQEIDNISQNATSSKSQKATSAVEKTTRGEATSTSSTQVTAPAKKFRSVFDALEAQEQAVEPRKSVRSLFDIIDKIATRDKQPVKASPAEQPTAVGRIFTEEFEHEMRAMDELERQQTQEKKLAKPTEEDDSDDIFNNIVEPCPLKEQEKDEAVRDDVLQRLLKKVKDGQRGREKHGQPPLSLAREPTGETDAPGKTKGFKKQKVAPTLGDGDEEAKAQEGEKQNDTKSCPARCLPITVTSTAVRQLNRKGRRSPSVSSSHEDGVSLPSPPPELRPKELSLVEKLRLRCGGDAVSGLTKPRPAGSGSQLPSIGKSHATLDRGAQLKCMEDESAESSSDEERTPAKKFHKQKPTRIQRTDSKHSVEEGIAPSPTKSAHEATSSAESSSPEAAATARVKLEDRVMSNVFEGLGKARPKKKPRCPFLDEEAALDSLDEDAVSSDETDSTASEMNSFVDQTSPTAQSQGMYLRLNAQLSPRGPRAARVLRNLVPIEDCFSASSAGDASSYDSEDSFVVKGDVDEPTLPLEITVIERPAERRRSSSSRRKKTTGKRRRRVYMLSEEEPTPPAEKSDNVSDEHLTTAQSLRNDEQKKDETPQRPTSNMTTREIDKNRPAIGVDANSGGQKRNRTGDANNPGLPCKVILVSMAVMEELPDILTGLNRTFEGYHIEPVDMTNFEDHQADIYIEDLCIKIVPLTVLASDHRQRKAKHQLARFKQIAPRPVLIIYTGANPPSSAVAMPILVHLVATNIRTFYASSQVEVLMLIKCLVPSSSSLDNSKLLQFLDCPDLCRLLEVPDLNISTATALLASRKEASKVFSCSCEDIARLCGVPEDFAKRIYDAFQTMRS